MCVRVCPCTCISLCECLFLSFGISVPLSVVLGALAWILSSFSFFFFIPPLNSSPIFVTPHLSPSALHVSLIFISFFHFLPKESKREKRAPWLSLASLSSLSISPRPWAHIAALPTQYPAARTPGPSQPQAQGNTSKLLMDSVGPSLFLRMLQCSQWWSLILPQNSRDHQLLYLPIWVPWTSLQSAVLLLTFSIKTLFHCLGKRKRTVWERGWEKRRK